MSSDPLFSLDAGAALLVLLAALLHAVWNALAKSSDDPFVNLAVVTSTGGIVALPFLFIWPLPSGETWKWLSLSAVIHYVYQLALVRMYRLGDFGQVYPIARGLAPLGVATLAAATANEPLGTTRLVGLVLAACGIFVLGRPDPNRVSSRSAVATALATAGLIGLYTYSDGRGVRSAALPEHYIAWSFVLGCVPFASTAALVRGRAGLIELKRGGLRAVGGGVMATLGYAIALWAMARAPMAAVASLREASVLFGAMIGGYVLGEPFGRRRVVAAAGLACGLFLVQLNSRGA